MILTLLMIFNSTWAFTSSFSIEIEGFRILDIGRTSGHEEITRQALSKTLQTLKENKSKVEIARAGKEIIHDLDAKKLGLIGALSSNPIVNGVYCSDFPTDESCVFNLAEFWFRENAKNVDWHNGEETQSLHFLRNYDAKIGLVSARKACEVSQQKILIASATSATEWSKGNIKNSLFLLGHALHIIQDSFSHAHVLRHQANGNYQIKDICYYGVDKRQELKFLKKEYMACYHPTVQTNSIDEAVLGDSIWTRTESLVKNVKFNFRDEASKLCPMTTHQYVLSDDDKIQCLNSEARLARDASVKYLYLMAEEFYKLRGKKINQQILNQLATSLKEKVLEGTYPLKGIVDRFPKGIANCSQLPN